MNATKLN